MNYGPLRHTAAFGLITLEDGSAIPAAEVSIVGGSLTFFDHFGEEQTLVAPFTFEEITEEQWAERTTSSPDAPESPEQP